MGNLDGKIKTIMKEIHGFCKILQDFCSVNLINAEIEHSDMEILASDKSFASI